MTQIPVNQLLVLLVGLIFISAFFSASETGMMSLNRYRLRHLARKGSPVAKIVVKLLVRPDRLLGLIVLGNTFVNILASAVATIIASHYFGDWGILLSTFSLTFVLLILGETAPKTFAAIHPETMSFIAAWPLKILQNILLPILWLTNLLSNGLLGLFGVRVSDYKDEALSLEELRSVVNEASGKISHGYKKILLRILDLERVTVEDVMVPRSEIYGLDVELDWDTLMQHLLNCPHSHVPIFKNTIDQVSGMLNLRKVLIYLQHEEMSKEKLLALADPVYFIPEGTLLNRQLLNFQQEEREEAVVVDEYGEILGFITVADIVQEVVGEFTRDIDLLSAMIRPQIDGSFLVDARINMRDLIRMTEWDLPLTGPKTLSGLIIEHLEMIPGAGLCLKLGDYPIEILKMRGNAVRLVKIFPILKE